jgi:dolichol-phosphate mannosyltransferase
MSLRIPELDLSSDWQSYLSLVVPTYNERLNIHALVERITQVLDPVLEQRYELIVVDDDSPDLTWELAQSLCADYPQLRVVRRQQERGLATAVIRGWQEAKGNILGVIDGDLQHPPQIIENLLAEIKGGADLAVASRYSQGGGTGEWSGIRAFLSRGAIRIALFLLPEVSGRLSDPMSGCFLLRRQAITNSPLSPIGYKILLEVVGRGKIRRIAEVGYTFDTRKEGSSKVTWQHYVDFILHLLRLRFATGSVPVGTVGRFLRFAMVGLSGVFVDFFVLLLLYKQFGIDFSVSKTVAVGFAIVNNFVWNDLWTFSDAAGQFTGWRARLIRFVRFGIACSLGAVINISVAIALKNVLGFNVLFANLIAIIISTAWNYLINLKFNWKAK